MFEFLITWLIIFGAAVGVGALTAFVIYPTFWLFEADCPELAPVWALFSVSFSVAVLVTVLS